MGRERQLLDLIDLIYEAAGQADRWPAFLERFAELAQTDMTAFLIHDAANGSADISASARWDPHWERLYQEHYSATNVWAKNGAALWKPGHFIPGEMVCSQKELLDSEWYQDWLRPQDLFHSYGGILWREGPVSCYLTCARSMQRGPFEEEVPLLEALLRICRERFNSMRESRVSKTGLMRLRGPLIDCPQACSSLMRAERSSSSTARRRRFSNSGTGFGSAKGVLRLRDETRIGSFMA
jgi:hypothetical protein